MPLKSSLTSSYICTSLVHITRTEYGFPVEDALHGELFDVRGLLIKLAADLRAQQKMLGMTPTPSPNGCFMCRGKIGILAK